MDVVISLSLLRRQSKASNVPYVPMSILTGQRKVIHLCISSLLLVARSPCTILSWSSRSLTGSLLKLLKDLGLTSHLIHPSSSLHTLLCLQWSQEQILSTYQVVGPIVTRSLRSSSIFNRRIKPYPQSYLTLIRSKAHHTSKSMSVCHSMSMR